MIEVNPGAPSKCPYPHLTSHALYRFIPIPQNMGMSYIRVQSVITTAVGHQCATTKCVPIQSFPDKGKPLTDHTDVLHERRVLRRTAVTAL